MHPQREELAAYLNGSLPEPLAHAVEGHLQTCPECDATLHELSSVGDTLIEKLRGGPPAASHANEPACQAMVEVIKDIGVDPSTPGSDRPAEADLGSLREYKLLKKLGEGGMGAVYRALHTKLDKVVALKVLPGGKMQNSAAVARFEREMKAVGHLHHPNIVGAHDAGEANGMHFLVMELVEGEDISALLKRQGPLAVADACELVRQAAVGLQEAHEHGMVHRDIKPSNLMLTVERRKNSATGIVKILDMGLALLDASQQPGAGDLTGSGQLMGTINYMAPEQATDTHAVDIRADIYALGVVLYELLTGQIPLEAKRNEPVVTKLMALISEPNRSIRELRPDLPKALAALVDRMLARQPADRPATPEDVATALEPFAADHHIAGLLDLSAAPQIPRAKTPGSTSVGSVARTVALPISAAGKAPPRKTNRIAIALAGAAAMLFVLLGVWVIIRNKDGQEVARVHVPDGGSATVVPEDATPANLKSEISNRKSGIPAPQSLSLLTSPDYEWSAPENLGPGINTSALEFLYGMTDDERLILFSSDRDLMMSRRDSKDEPFPKGQLLPEAINRDVNKATMTGDGLLLAICTKREKNQAADIWLSERKSIAEPFGEPIRLAEPVNSDATQRHPVFSSDGLTLLLTSTRARDASADIYLFRRGSRAAPFGEAILLPAPINTSEWDIPCWISNDGRVLCTRSQANKASISHFWIKATLDAPFVEVPRPAPWPNDVAAEVHISADGERIYFNSTSLANDYGAHDIWVTRRVPRKKL